jgi:hypothetical protein
LARSALFSLDPRLQESAAGGNITINANTTNTGTIQTLAGGTVTLNNGQTTSGTGTITTDANPASKVLQNGATISGNTIGGTLVYNNSGGGNILSGRLTRE